MWVIENVIAKKRRRNEDERPNNEHFSFYTKTDIFHWKYVSIIHDMRKKNSFYLLVTLRFFFHLLWDSLNSSLLLQIHIVGRFPFIEHISPRKNNIQQMSKNVLKFNKQFPFMSFDMATNAYVNIIVMGNASVFGLVVSSKCYTYWIPFCCVND